MALRIASVAAVALLLGFAPPIPAGEQSMQGEFLRLSSHRRSARVRLGAVGHAPDEQARSRTDPSITGATLEVLGDQVLGADGPPVPLPAENWRALGDPPGSRGFRYFDASGRFGVRRAALRFGNMAAFSLVGGGPAWPYRTVGTPTTVLVRLSVGGDVFCTTFGTFRRAPRGAMVAGHNPPPGSCQAEGSAPLP